MSFLRLLWHELHIAAIIKATLVGVVPFMVGLVATKLYDVYTNPKGTTTSISVSSIALTALLCMVFLGFAVAAAFAETMRQVDSLRLNLGVEFVAEGGGDAEGLTYERTRHLIEVAKHSLVFLDYSIEPRLSTASDGRSVGSERRIAYYAAIVKKIASHSYDGGGVFHRRLVQLPGWSDGVTQLDRARNDDVYIDHLKTCRDMQAQHCSTEVKGAAPYVHTHFAIIDRRYVVWPILRANPERGGLTRHGAFFIEDRNEQLVRKLMELFEKIDGNAIPLDFREA